LKENSKNYDNGIVFFIFCFSALFFWKRRYRAYFYSKKGSELGWFFI